MEHPYRQFDDTETTDFMPQQKSSIKILNNKVGSMNNQQQPSIGTPTQAASAPPMQNVHLDNNSGGGGSRTIVGGKVRLRAIETEAEHFLKMMNVTILRWLILVQAIATGTVFVSQILLYANATQGYYKPVDYAGIGIWGPIFFFATACGLTWLATKNPSGCSIGTAMGFQITTSIIATILLLLSIISLIMHGHYNYSVNYSKNSTYDPEVPGRVFCSFMILAAAAVIVTAVFASVHFCRAVCCGRQRTMESIMFDVETLK